MEKLSDIIPRLSGELRKKSDYHEQLVFWVWENELSEAMRKNLKPKSFSKGTLTLQAENPRWAQVLKKEEEREKIKTKINCSLTNQFVKSIVICLKD